MKNRMWSACAGAVAMLMLLPGSPALGAAEDRDLAVAAARHFLHALAHHGKAEADREARGFARRCPASPPNGSTFSGGGAQTDALLAGGVDILNTGTGNLLLLWDRTRGGVKGIVATSAQPMTLISRDPNIKSIKDFGPNDKIAVPTVKVSTQAIVLQIAAAEAFGADQWSKLDANTVQLGHPDAYVAMTNSQHEVRNHFCDSAVHLPRTEERSRRACGAVVARRDGRPAQPGAVLHHDQIRRRQSEDHPGGARRHQGGAGPDPQRHQDCGRDLQGGHRRQDQRRGSAGVAQGARHDGVEPAAAGHHEIRRPSVQDRHAEDPCQRPGPTIICRSRTT